MENKIIIREKEYTSDEIELCSELYQEIVKRHKICNGLGINKKGDDIIDCECEYVYKYVKELVFARVPKGFWALSLVDVISNELESFIMTKVNCNSLISGVSNSGKTTLLCYLAKYFIQYYDRVVCLTGSSILDMLRDKDRTLIDRVYSSKYVFIDDVDKFDKYGKNIDQVEIFLRKLYDKGIICIIVVADNVNLRQNMGDAFHSSVSKFNSHAFALLDEISDVKSFKVLDYMNKDFIDESLQFVAE